MKLLLFLAVGFLLRLYFQQVRELLKCNRCYKSEVKETGKGLATPSTSELINQSFAPESSPLYRGRVKAIKRGLNTGGSLAMSGLVEFRAVLFIVLFLLFICFMCLV